MLSHLSFVVWGPAVAGPESVVARQVSTPVLRYGTSQRYAARDMVDDQVRALAQDELRLELDLTLEEKGLRLVEAPTLHEDHDVMRDQVTLQLVALVADHWEDGAWSTARAAVDADQRWLAEPRGD